MKRELKLLCILCTAHCVATIAEPIPMKRELKHEFQKSSDQNDHIIAEPIPMKRELKPWCVHEGCSRILYIAEPIPMKRELKPPVMMAYPWLHGDGLQSLSR